jgi:hypothetical protein
MNEDSTPGAPRLTGETPPVARAPWRMPLPISLAIGFALVVASIGAFVAFVPGCMLKHTLGAGQGAARDAAKFIADMFHLRTEVKHGGSLVVYEASQPVQQYVALEEVIHREKSWNVTGWFFQEKGVDTEHRVLAKYGFDWEKGTVSVREEPLTGKLVVTYPEPELLSVEVLKEDWARRDSLFNKVTDQDIKDAQEMLRVTARSELSRDESRLAKARQIFEQRVREALKMRGQEVDRFEPSVPKLTEVPAK